MQAGALVVVQDLIGAANLYVRDGERSGVLDTQLLRSIALWATNVRCSSVVTVFVERWTCLDCNVSPP